MSLGYIILICTGTCLVYDVLRCLLVIQCAKYLARQGLKVVSLDYEELKNL